MRKFYFLAACVLLLLTCFWGNSAFAAEAVGTFSYYDTAEVSYGSFALPEFLDNHTFYGELHDRTKTSIADFSPEAFSSLCSENGTDVFVTYPNSFEEGEYTFVLTVEDNVTKTTTKYTIPIQYAVARPYVEYPEFPVGQGQYRVFFKDLLLSDTSALDVSLLNEMQEMVATTYTEFSSENLVGSMTTRTPSGIPGYSFVEMVTLFQTGAIVKGDYQLFFNIDEKLVSYQDTCRVFVVDSPIIHSVSAALSGEVLYGENHLHPMVSGSSGFDIIVTGFQINPEKLSAVLYNQDGNRVAKSESFLYHDSLLLGYGVINGYQEESGIQAMVLHMNVSSSAVLNEGENYRISLSYDDSRLYGNKEAFCSPETGLYVVSAEPYDVSSITLTVVNSVETVNYDVFLYDDAYGEIQCGSFTIPSDGVLDFEVDSYLTNGQGVLLGEDGSFVQFFYKNELLGLFIPQEVHVNPVVLHPTTTEFVAHFEMVNFSLSETADIDVQLIKFAEKINGAYVGVEAPYSVAGSSGIKSVVRSKQDGYFNTDLLIEMKVNSALDEEALYSYLLNIDGHEIYLIDQGEEYIVQVANNTVYHAEILDRTILGGIPVQQDELYFWCNGVVVRDPASLRFVLVDGDGTVVADMSQDALVPLSIEAEQQFCGKLTLLSPLYVGNSYRLVAWYGTDVLYTSEEYYGSDEVFGTVLVQEEGAASSGENVVTVFSQLTNVPLESVSFEVVDLLEPFETLDVLAVRTAYNFDTYYQWKHTLTLSRPLHEGVYKVVLLVDGVDFADAMINVSSKTMIKDIIAVESSDVPEYQVILDNCREDALYGLMFGRTSSLSDAKVIEYKQSVDGILHLRREELSDLAVGEYNVFLLQDGIPTSRFIYFHSPFLTTLEIIDGNVIDGELDEGEAVLSVVFSQALNINTVSTQTVQLIDSEGFLQRIAVSTSSDRHTLYVHPQFVLHAGAQYKLLLTSALRGIDYGQLRSALSLSFTVRDGDQTKMDFFVPNGQATDLSTDGSFLLSFLEDSFDEDALLGVWTEDVSIDLSDYVGLKQESSVLVITDYQDDTLFQRAALLTLYNMDSPGEKSYVLLKHNPQTARFEEVGECVFKDGTVYTPISGCGRYVLCISDHMPFEDVRGSWAEEYVKTLWHQKIISGYDETFFGAEWYVTRSEFIKMLINALNLTLLDPEEYNLRLFRDYKEVESWALPFWTTAYQLNIIKGTAANTLSPNEYITRAEIVTIIGRAKAFVSTGANDFKDSAEVPTWAVGYFNAAFENGLITGYPDGTVRPNSCATRAETAKIICNLMNIE